MQLQPHYVIASFARDPACRNAWFQDKFRARYPCDNRWKRGFRETPSKDAEDNVGFARRSES